MKVIYNIFTAVPSGFWLSAPVPHESVFIGQDFSIILTYPMTLSGLEVSQVDIAAPSFKTSAIERRDLPDSPTRRTENMPLPLLIKPGGGSEDRVQAEVLRRSASVRIHFRPISKWDKGEYVCTGVIAPIKANDFILNGTLYSLITLLPISEFNN